LRECQTCGSTFFVPEPAPESLNKFYSVGGYDFNPNSQNARARKIAKKFLLGQPKGRFLDVGCATGFLLAAIRNETGWDVHGVELSDKAADFARETLKLNCVLNKALEDASYPDAFFDVVHVSEVLEHVPNPQAFLKECRRVLKPGGLFFLSLPNGLADRQGLLDFWRLYRKPPGHGSGHIYFFSPDGLEAMFRATGFRVLETKTYAFKQGLRAMGLFPTRARWERLFQPRQAAEVPNKLKIEFPRQRYPEFYYKLKYGLREKLEISGLKRWGLGWHLVLQSTSDIAPRR
jgi:2-polyprenyl-3-methyl-5-hydroxy-6-metoxy-1,4-benzoquinol methylase